MHPQAYGDWTLSWVRRLDPTPADELALLAKGRSLESWKLNTLFKRDDYSPNVSGQRQWDVERKTWVADRLGGVAKSAGASPPPTHTHAPPLPAEPPARRQPRRCPYAFCCAFPSLSLPSLHPPPLHRLTRPRPAPAPAPAATEKATARRRSPLCATWCWAATSRTR